MGVPLHPIAAALLASLGACAAAAPTLPPLPAWVQTVGARSRPPEQRVFDAGSFGAVGDGRTLDTAAIQRAIDGCSAAGGGTVRFAPGRYLTGALFLKTGVRLRVDPGVTLVASRNDADYPILPTRVAGIDMPWPAALINVNGQRDVEVSGGGVIDGEGQYWWKKYWDLRRRYAAQGLRWAADYDCRRVRLLVVWRSRDVTIEGVRLRRSGFWTVQVAYSDSVTVRGVTIADNFEVDGIRGASTDGVDVDSSRRVLVERCDIDNNDDDICLKAGRDADGLRVDRPTEYVVVRDNVCRRGGGVVSFGSETSGGIRHVVAWGNTGLGTSEGIRFKSTPTRGGYVEDVLVEKTTLVNVPLAFTFTLDWDPAYSQARIPPGYRPVPSWWRTITEPVTPPERGYTRMRDITLAGIQVRGARRIVTAVGLPQDPVGPVRWIDVTAAGQTAGSVRWAQGWTMHDVHFVTADGRPLARVDCQGVAAPTVARATAAPNPSPAS